jgi:hypothetical protein
MPPPGFSAEEELNRYKNVLKEWRFTGFIDWKQLAVEWLRDNLEGHTQRSIGELMHEHREQVDQTPETRDRYRDRYSFHYDFRILINGQRIYIETVFDPGVRDGDDKIRVVNIKPA